MKKNLPRKILTHVFVLLLVCTGSSVTAKGDIKGFAIDWQASFFNKHKLVGSIWDTHKDAFISAKQFRNELVHYDYIFLGETHNNPDHHQLQAIVINTLVENGLKPSIVMEMLSLQKWQDQPQQWSELAALQAQAGKLNKGWPWELYKPVLQTVVEHRLDLYAGNISRKELQRWSEQQNNQNKQDVFKEYDFTQENYRTLSENIVASHCGYGGEEFVTTMSRAQMQRDRIMVESIIGKRHPVVFIAGSGHIRNDYAVPMQLRRKYQQSSYLSVAFISVQEVKSDPRAYLQNGKAIYDMLIFTPSHTNQDPCEKFRKQLKNMHHRHTP